MESTPKGSGADQLSAKSSGGMPEGSLPNRVDEDKEATGAVVGLSVEEGLRFLSNFSSEAIIKIATAHGIQPAALNLNDEQVHKLLAGMYAADQINFTSKLSSALGMSRVSLPVPEVSLDHHHQQIRQNSESDGTKRSKIDIKSPKQWTGGGLYDWDRWSRIFIDIADELKYTEDEGVKRLTRFTDPSPECTVIRMLLSEGCKWRVCLVRKLRRCANWSCGKEATVGQTRPFHYSSFEGEGRFGLGESYRP